MDASLETCIESSFHTKHPQIKVVRTPKEIEATRFLDIMEKAPGQATVRREAGNTDQANLQQDLHPSESGNSRGSYQKPQVDNGKQLSANPVVKPTESEGPAEDRCWKRAVEVVLADKGPKASVCCD